MKKLRDYLNAHPVIGLCIRLSVGCCALLVSWKAAEVLIVEASKIPYGIQIIGLIFGAFFVNWAFWTAYEMQDEAWYMYYAQKTGDDFEGREIFDYINDPEVRREWLLRRKKL